MDVVPFRGATDPRDKIFGFVGCFEPRVRGLIKVDYSKGLVDILTEMTVLLIKETGSLDAILFAKGEMKEEPAMCLPGRGLPTL
jgi:hypothetical protein